MAYRRVGRFIHSRVIQVIHSEPAERERERQRGDQAHSVVAGERGGTESPELDTLCTLSYHTARVRGSREGLRGGGRCLTLSSSSKPAAASHGGLLQRGRRRVEDEVGGEGGERVWLRGGGGGEAHTAVATTAVEAIAAARGAAAVAAAEEGGGAGDTGEEEGPGEDSRAWAACENLKDEEAEACIRALAQVTAGDCVCVRAQCLYSCRAKRELLFKDFYLKAIARIQPWLSHMC